MIGTIIEVVCEFKQKAYKFIEKWCKESALCINPDKTHKKVYKVHANHSLREILTINEILNKKNKNSNERK